MNSESLIRNSLRGRVFHRMISQPRTRNGYYPANSIVRHQYVERRRAVATVTRSRQAIRLGWRRCRAGDNRWMYAPASGGSGRRIGTNAEVAWIADGTSVGLTITSAIPPVFDAYATIVVPEDDHSARQTLDRTLVSILRDESPDQNWWLGYLDAGPDNIDAADPFRVTLYADWPYVLVEAGPHQALNRRTVNRHHDRTLPDLIFPSDRRWLVSRLWDDDWICIGGPDGLMHTLLRHPDLEARQVELGQDATPPGHTAI